MMSKHEHHFHRGRSHPKLTGPKCQTVQRCPGDFLAHSSGTGLDWDRKICSDIFGPGGLQPIVQFNMCTYLSKQ